MVQYWCQEVQYTINQSIKEGKKIIMDKKIKCLDCGEEFLFTERDQEFYAEKGFTEPKRCKSCRKLRKDGAIGGKRNG